MKGKHKTMPRVLWEKFGTDIEFTDAQARDEINRVRHTDTSQGIINSSLAKMRYAGQIVEVSKVVNAVSVKEKVGKTIVHRVHKCLPPAEQSINGHVYAPAKSVQSADLTDVTPQMGSWVGLIV